MSLTFPRHDLFWQATAAIVVAAVFLVGTSQGNDNVHRSANEAIRSSLALRIETKLYENPLPLRDALGLFTDSLQQKNQSVDVIVDGSAFRNVVENGSVDLYKADVSIPPLPKTLTAEVALQKILEKLPVESTFLVRAGAVVIVPVSYLRNRDFLNYPILTRFENAPLEHVLEELSDLSGISIALDATAAKDLRTKVSLNLRNVPLEDALVLVTEMVGLKYVLLNQSVIVTSPERASQIAEDEKCRRSVRSAAAGTNAQ